MIRPTIEFHPAADREIRSARRWYAARSPSAALSFVAELDRAIAKIAKDPQRSPAYLFGTRRVLLRRFPYIVVYRETPLGARVIAIAHGRRRPGYWKSR
jgi:plasmid stabilization system protein ParE